LGTNVYAEIHRVLAILDTKCVFARIQLFFGL
jgi:hypothetical protein